MNHYKININTYSDDKCDKSIGKQNNDTRKNGTN